MQNVEFLPALNINELLINDPPATFLVRVTGNSMENAGIFAGDLLVIDKGLTPRHGSIVIASVDGEFTVKRLYHKDARIALIAENPDYPAIEFQDGNELEVWGVVIGCVRRFYQPTDKRL